MVWNYLHEIPSPIFLEVKKNVITLPSAEPAQRLVKDTDNYGKE